jgi:hypothetical protein
VYITETSGDDSSVTATDDNEDEHIGKPTCAVFIAALVASCLGGASAVKRKVVMNCWSKREIETLTSGRLVGCLLSALTTTRKRRTTVSKVNVERDSEGAVLPWCGPSMSLMRDSCGCVVIEEEGRKKDAQSSIWTVLTMWLRNRVRAGLFNLCK